METGGVQILQTASPSEPVSDSDKGSPNVQQSVPTLGQHPGFILLSVKHEKIHNAQPAARAIPGGQKATTLPQRKVSRKRLRKLTPGSRNPDNLRAVDFDLLSTDCVPNLGASVKEGSSARSRFRVTRIADSSSWWIPENPKMYICVHDLRTSSLPDFVKIQYQKVLSSLSVGAINYSECGKDFWNCLEPNYLQNVNKGTGASLL
ncbi:unnamed protein product [Hydatigera taeniaeformis]|uniref:SET domain bifurcated histone lysine methyltransferase 2 n=1 Tax=Hydatigena taeniaeformis TaxID=6205 RepID=A0A0R3X625_HYDTA|nr:unnamed protein product [Hydatigera taeniaeformis]